MNAQAPSETDRPNATVRPEDLERVLATFGRSRDPEGRRVRGLRLYLSRRIVQAHGGELTVRSTPGVGSTFGFALEVAP